MQGPFLMYNSGDFKTRLYEVSDNVSSLMSTTYLDIVQCLGVFLWQKGEGKIAAFWHKCSAAVVFCPINTDSPKITALHTDKHTHTQGNNQDEGTISFF